MAHGDIQGSAYTDPRRPRAKAVCDYCGEWYLLSRLNKQMEFFGPTLKWTGFLVCSHCLDTPQDQLRPIILPPDPLPVVNPRQENLTNDYRVAPFTQYLLYQPNQAGDASKAEVLAAAATASGIPTPGAIVDQSGSLAAGNTGQTIMAANPTRTWVLIYSPPVPALQVAVGAVLWGTASNLILGPGEAILSSGSGTAPVGAISGIGLIPGMPYYAWEAS